MKNIERFFVVLLFAVALSACRNDNEKVVIEFVEAVNAELANFSGVSGIESASCEYDGNDVVITFGLDLPDEFFKQLQSSLSLEMASTMVAPMKKCYSQNGVDTDPVFQAMIEENCRIVVKMINRDGEAVNIEISPEDLISE